MPSQISVAPTPDALVHSSDTSARRRGVRTRKAPLPLQKVIHVSAELWPFAWSGGLGHAVADLAAQQSRIGMSVTTVVPLYAAARSRVGGLRQAFEPFHVHQGGAPALIQCWETQRLSPGPRVIFVDHPESFHRPGLYGEPSGDYPDNDRRFSILALAALEIARRLGAHDRLVIHAHDWHAALTPVYLSAARAADPDFHRMASVVSVHNAGYQGVFGRESLAPLGLAESLWHQDGMEWYGHLNFLKGGIGTADCVTTVSATHAGEICTDVGGFGLQDSFRRLGNRLVGIRNGIDQNQWDPETDSEIPMRYGPGAPAGKQRCKSELQLASRLPRVDVPLFVMSARMVKQKGIDLVIGSRVVRESSAQFVFMGQGESVYETALAALAAEHPGRIAARGTFNDRFEHLLLSGADYLLMPSLYEPCGLTQMRAQRYGTLPVARRTGGLAETVVDGETGFLFDGYTVEDLDGALRRAIELYADPGALRRRAVDAMCRDFSWSEPLAQYDEVYRRALAAH